MLILHKDFHSFSTPDQIILNECCTKLRIPEHFEIIDKLKNVQITQGLSYFFQIILNECCPHLRIPEHFEIIDTMKNVNISLDQCNKTNSLKSMHHDNFEPTCTCQKVVPPELLLSL